MMFDIEIDIDVDVDVGVEVVAVCSLLMLEDDPPLNKSIQEMELVYSPLQYVSVYAAARRSEFCPVRTGRW